MQDDAALERDEQKAEQEQPIAVIVEHRPEIVLLDEKKRDALFAHIEAEVEAFVPDMTTAKGRDECRSLAAKVTRTKTAINDARLKLTEEARAKIKAINEEGATITERLKSLSDRARAPLTAWETAEEARQAECKAALDRIRGAASVPLGTTSDGIKARIAEIEAEPMGEGKWQAMLTLATEARDTTLAALRAALEHVVASEEREAELARLREAEAARLAEEAKREALEREERENREREEREAEEERQRQEREEQERADAAERERVAAETAAREAEERAREEERQRAEAERLEQERKHEAALLAERQRADQAEREAEEERRRREAEDAERERLDAEVAAERARLEADQERRTQAKTEAKKALMTIDGVTEEMAKAIVLLIIAGEVPRVFLDFAAVPKVSSVPAAGQGGGDNEGRML